MTVSPGPRDGNHEESPSLTHVDVSLSVGVVTVRGESECQEVSGSRRRSLPASDTEGSRRHGRVHSDPGGTGKGRRRGGLRFRVGVVSVASRPERVSSV